MAELSEDDVALLRSATQQINAVLGRLLPSALPPAPAAAAAPAPGNPPLTSPAAAAPAAAGNPDPNVVTRPIAWGARVSKTFVARAWWIAVTLGFDPDWLMSDIAWESGRTFRADVRNMAGSGATGLIQFMPRVAVALGSSVDALARMSAEDQLNFVYKYFRPFAGKIHTFADGYMAILWPAAVGQSDDDKLFTGGVAYRQNSGLDADKDGVVTKLEAAARPLALLASGRKPENLGTGA